MRQPIRSCLYIRSRCYASAVVLQDREYRQLWGCVNSETGHLDLLDDTQEVCIPQKDPSKDAVEDDGGLFSVDILDPSLYVPLHVVYYFHNLIWFLKKHKYEPAKTLFGFGYDFRQSNMSHMDALVARLEAASAAKGGVKCAPASPSPTPLCSLFTGSRVLPQS